MRKMKIGDLLQKYPFVSDFFEQNRLDVTGFEDKSFEEFVQSFQEDEMEDLAMDIQSLPEELETYLSQMMEFLGLEKSSKVKVLTLFPGRNKSGKKETFEKLDIYPSSIVSIVGPTGSGKSRLLADIEWAAQGDTPTQRSILINGEKPDPRWRYSPNNKLVAQLSQNMNFVMDISAGEFVLLHAQSRMVENPQRLTREILEAANKLAGEGFAPDTAVTSLSGGQSRALMIADTAILSSSPIVLIDEIENAGIDRKKALELLVSQDKIVLMATHDPLLALMADYRIVIQNGGIEKILETTQEEKSLLNRLHQLDGVLQRARTLLRSGETLEQDKVLY